MEREKRLRIGSGCANVRCVSYEASVVFLLNYLQVLCAHAPTPYSLLITLKPGWSFFKSKSHLIASLLKIFQWFLSHLNESQSLGDWSLALSNLLLSSPWSSLTQPHWPPWCSLNAKHSPALGPRLGTPIPKSLYGFTPSFYSGLWSNVTSSERASLLSKIMPT